MPTIAYYVSAAIALVAIWLIFCAAAEPSPKIQRIGNIAIGAICAILAIKAIMAIL
jgi:hypothetical protein